MTDEGQPATALGGVSVEFFDDTGRGLGGATTDVSGSYTSPGLPTGTYNLRTRNGLGYADELYDNRSCTNGSCNPKDGDPVAVTVGVPTPGVNFGLARAGSISGAVTAVDDLDLVHGSLP